MEETRIKGYRKKPATVYLASAVFFLIPLVLLFQVCWISGGSLLVLGKLLKSGYFLQEWLLCWLAALAVFVVSRFSFVFFLLLGGYVLCTKIFRLAVYPALEGPASILITLIWLAVVILFLASPLKAPYLNPRLRWWTRPRRVGLSRQAVLFVQEGKIPVEVLNLSEKGAFVRVEGEAQQEKFPQRLGERFRFATDLFQGGRPGKERIHFSTEARLVWLGRPGTPYRCGLGIQFLDLTRQKRKALRDFLRHAVWE